MLCAPALHLPQSIVDLTAPPVAPTIIVHGVRDEVVPIAASRAWAARHHVRVIEVDGDHGLAGSVLVIIATLRLLQAGIVG
jgi:pimeloyl-ACP methyl ester carboxylesterase